MLRGFTDSTGVEWRVWEVFPTRPGISPATESLSKNSLLRAFANGWLCFESSQQKRRLAPIPPGWEFLEPLLLEQMCQQAEPVALRKHEHVVDGVRVDEFSARL